MSDINKAAQIIEGRNEALDHLGINPEQWERLAHGTRRNRTRLEAARSATSKAAALTVAIAEERISDSPLGVIKWHFTAVQIGLTEPLRQTDYALQA